MAQDGSGKESGRFSLGFRARGVVFENKGTLGESPARTIEQPPHPVS